MISGRVGWLVTSAICWTFANAAVCPGNTSSCTNGPLMLQARQLIGKHGGNIQRLSLAGMMTMWSDSSTTIVGGSCEYANSGNGGINSPAASSPYVASRTYCAADDALYSGGAACGSCWLVSYDGSPATDPGRAGSLVVQIVDSGSAKTFDCQLTAFNIITGASTGVFPIHYEPVDCEVSSGGPVVTVLDGSNAWYTKVIFSNLPRGVLHAAVVLGGEKLFNERSKWGHMVCKYSRPDWWQSICFLQH